VGFFDQRMFTVLIHQHMLLNMIKLVIFNWIMFHLILYTTIKHCLHITLKMKKNRISEASLKENIYVQVNAAIILMLGKVKLKLKHITAQSY
jgi:hypothetical protein